MVAYANEEKVTGNALDTLSLDGSANGQSLIGRLTITGPNGLVDDAVAEEE